MRQRQGTISFAAPSDLVNVTGEMVARRGAGFQIRDINHLFPGQSQRFLRVTPMETQRQDPHPNQVWRAVDTFERLGDRHAGT